MKFHDELCDKIFNGEDLKPEVSEKLLEIADAFIEFLEVPTDAIKDFFSLRYNDIISH